MKIGIITLIYDDFDFDKFYENVEKFFLPIHQKIFYIFTNKTEYIYKKDVQIYYSRKDLGLYTNISEIINDLEKDNVQMLFYCSLNIKFTLETGSKMMPNDDLLFSSINKEGNVMFYNLPAILNHIEGKEDKMVYGSYVENFVDLIKYYKEIETGKQEN